MTMKRRSVFVWAAAVIAFGWVARLAAFADEKLDPTGTWTWNRTLEGQTEQSVLTLSYKDGKLTGSYKRAGQTVPISKGKVENRRISFESEGTWNEQKMHGKFRGILSHSATQGDMIQGDIDLTIADGSIPLPWLALRGVDLDAITGEWKIKVVAPDGKTFEPTLKLFVEEGSLKGKYKGRTGEVDATQVSLEGMELSWKVVVDRDRTKVRATYRGNLAGNSIKGTLDYNDNTGTLDFSGKRLAAEPPKKAE
jgi:autotransporter translocation and assembly factor TamB